MLLIFYATEFILSSLPAFLFTTHKHIFYISLLNFSYKIRALYITNRNIIDHCAQSCENIHRDNAALQDTSHARKLLPVMSPLKIVQNSQLNITENIF